jgi:hypothetical protein
MGQTLGSAGQEEVPPHGLGAVGGDDLALALGGIQGLRTTRAMASSVSGQQGSQATTERLEAAITVGRKVSPADHPQVEHIQGPAPVEAASRAGSPPRDG